MLIYVIRRLLVAIPTILLLVIAAFAMMHLAPGGAHAKPQTES